MGAYRISFDPPTFPAFDLKDGAELSRELTIRNSPLLFGCRSGLCGTCLIEVVEGFDSALPPAEDEREALEVYAPDNALARLACQIRVKGDLTLRKIESL